MPRDYVNEVEVAPNGKVWFSSAAHNLGGLMSYDGKEWRRSAGGQIPEVFIKSVKVDHQNNIWFCTVEGIFILKQ